MPIKLCGVELHNGTVTVAAGDGAGGLDWVVLWLVLVVRGGACGSSWLMPWTSFCGGGKKRIRFLGRQLGVLDV